MPKENRGIESDILSSKLQELKRSSDKKTKQLIERVRQLEGQLEEIKEVKEVSTHRILPSRKGGNSEATAVVLASDWHYEEEVKAASVNGLNVYNLGIAKQRVEQFFRTAVRITKVLSRDIEINTMVLALLGDFISNQIHEELVEVNQLLPTEAISEVQNLIASGIEYLLRELKVNLVVPCHHGNHSRITRKQRHATEAGHSLEFFMYHALAAHFKGNPRVRFIISPSYHSYIEVYEWTIRFHHGHDVRYQGGVGGLSIPLNKAIAQWNKGRKADLECLAHWHQFRDFGNAIVNGSLIGFNAYALSIKADFEKPKQAYFLIDRKRGKTMTTPVCFDM